MSGPAFGYPFATVRPPWPQHNMINWKRLLASLLILVLQRWLPKVPGALVAVVASIARASVLDLADHGVGLVGPLPQGFPPFSIPRTSWSNLDVLVGGALGITSSRSPTRSRPHHRLLPGPVKRSTATKNGSQLSADGTRVVGGHDLLAQWGECDHRELEVSQPERDADDRQAQRDAGHHVHDCQPQPGEHQPEDVADGRLG